MLLVLPSQCPAAFVLLSYFLGVNEREYLSKPQDRVLRHLRYQWHMRPSSAKQQCQTGSGLNSHIVVVP